MPYEPMRHNGDNILISGNSALKPDLDKQVEEAFKEVVNHPQHYNLHPSGVECIDIVRHENFNRGNAIKYIWRAGYKEGTMDAEIRDLEKAAWYIADEIQRLKALRGKLK
jgi:hypothetical protein